jgi:hypothetical protein
MWLIVPGKGLLAALSAIYTMIHRYTPPTIRYVYPQHRGRGNTQHVIVEKEITERRRFFQRDSRSRRDAGFDLRNRIICLLFCAK